MAADNRGGDVSLHEAVEVMERQIEKIRTVHQRPTGDEG
jgi:hypothetical protein